MRGSLLLGGRAPGPGRLVATRSSAKRCGFPAPERSDCPSMRLETSAINATVPLAPQGHRPARRRRRSPRRMSASATRERRRAAARGAQGPAGGRGGPQGGRPRVPFGHHRVRGVRGPQLPAGVVLRGAPTRTSRRRPHPWGAPAAARPDLTPLRRRSRAQSDTDKGPGGAEGGDPTARVQEILDRAVGGGGGGGARGCVRLCVSASVCVYAALCALLWL
jgi:hypothetical protein